MSRESCTAHKGKRMSCSASYFLFDSDPVCWVANLWPVSQRREGHKLALRVSQNSLSSESSDLFQKSRAGRRVSGALLVRVSLHISANITEILSHRIQREKLEEHCICLANIAVFHNNVGAWPLERGFFWEGVHYANAAGCCSLCLRCCSHETNTRLWSPPLRGEQKRCLHAKVHIIGMAVLRSVLSMQKKHLCVLFVLH